MRALVPLLALAVLVSCPGTTNYLPDRGGPTDAGPEGDWRPHVDGPRREAGGKPDAGEAADGPGPLDQSQPPDAPGPPADQKVKADAGCSYPLPAGWPAGFTPWARNPVVIPTKGAAAHGADNIYAPEIHAVSGAYLMWYGGQGAKGHDRIFLASSADGASWRKWPSDDAPKAVLDTGGSNHVNDPSVVKLGGTWMMYYTDAATGIADTVWLATATKPTGFKKVKKVLGPGKAGSWEDLRVGRPAALYEGGKVRLWYDGTSKAGGRHVGYAESSDGKTFSRSPFNPVLKNAGAVDVKKVGGVYVLLYESGNGTYWATSVDGVRCWKARGKLFGLSGKAYDQHGQVTPFLQLSGGKVKAVWFGGASVKTWNKNRVAVAWAAGVKAPPGGGCSGCTNAGLSCAAACQAAGAGAAGICAKPGSTNPGACCACGKSPCASCLGKHKDCHAACVAAGKAGGRCAHPGSTNPGVCCACY